MYVKKFLKALSDLKDNAMGQTALHTYNFIVLLRHTDGLFQNMQLLVYVALNLSGFNFLAFFQMSKQFMDCCENSTNGNC